MFGTKAEIDVVTLAYFKAFAAGYGSTYSGRDDLIEDQLIPAISSVFEQYMKRYLMQKERTKYLDVEYDGQEEWWLEGVPVTALAVYYDQSRGFSTALSSDNAIIHPNERSFFLSEYEVLEGKKVLKVVYTGGMATSTAQVTLTMVAGGTGTFTAGNNIRNDGESTDLGEVVSWDGTSRELVVKSLVANCTNLGLSAGDVVDEGADDPQWTIASISAENLVNNYPDVAKAASLQLINVLKSKDHVGEESYTILEATGQLVDQELPSKVRDLLDPHCLEFL